MRFFEWLMQNIQKTDSSLMYTIAWTTAYSSLKSLHLHGLVQSFIIAMLKLRKIHLKFCCSSLDRQTLQGYRYALITVEDVLRAWLRLDQYICQGLCWGICWVPTRHLSGYLSAHMSKNMSWRASVRTSLGVFVAATVRVSVETSLDASVGASVRASVCWFISHSIYQFTLLNV